MDEEAVMCINDKLRKKLIPFGYKYYSGEYSPDSAYSIWVSRSVNFEREISISSTMFPSCLIVGLYKFFKENKDKNPSDFEVKTDEFGMMARYGFYKNKLIDRTIDDPRFKGGWDYSPVYWIDKDLVKFLLPLIDDIYLKNLKLK